MNHIFVMFFIYPSKRSHPFPLAILFLLNVFI